MKRIQLLFLALLFSTGCSKPSQITPVVVVPYARITVDAIYVNRTSNSEFIDTVAGDNDSQKINVAIAYNNGAYRISVYGTGAFYISFSGACSTDTGVYNCNSGGEYYQYDTTQYYTIGGTAHITQDSSGIINGIYSLSLRDNYTGNACSITGTISVENNP